MLKNILLLLITCDIAMILALSITRQNIEKQEAWFTLSAIIITIFLYNIKKFHNFLLTRYIND